MTFVVPAIQLIDQAVEMFYEEGIKDVGVIQADHPLTNWSRPIQVASIQTIRSRGIYPESQVVVIDECHQLHKEHIKWMTHPDWQSVPFIGLSATPWTRGLGKYFQSLLIMSTTKELIDLGYLSSFRVFAADHPDLSDVKTVAGDYHEGQLATAMNRPKLIANAVQTWKTLWGKDKTLLFAVDCAHAQQLQERFNEAGIACGYQDADTSSADRASLKRAFHNGDLKIISNIGTLTTGVDWDVRCLQLCRPTKSEMLFVQIVGRALRKAPGKDHAVILDHTDTHLRLGFVTDIHHDTLHGGKMDQNKPAARSAPLPKACPKCACLVPPGVMTCTECGHEFKIISKLYEREGQLAELSPNGRPKNMRDSRAYPYSYDEKRMFYAQLKAYGENRGFKPGWAKLKFREKFNGEWPAWSWEMLPPADRIGTEVSTFIRAKYEEWRTDPRNPANRLGA